MKSIHPLLLLAAVLCSTLWGPLNIQAGQPQTAFSYQGILKRDGRLANGQFLMEFQLLDASSGQPVGNPALRQVSTIDGVFTVRLDFGPVFGSTPYLLRMAVGQTPGQLVPLDPPQPLDPTPLAMFAQTAGNVPVSGLPPTIPRTDQPVILTELLRLNLVGGNGSLFFGPTDDCSLGINPLMPGLTERDPTGFRLLGRNNEGCRLIFGPTMDCTVEIDPGGPSGLLLRDPRGVRILSPSPVAPPVLRFGPTDDCSIGIAPGLTGLAERDPVGFRLLGQGNQGCRLLFGPTDLCTVEVDPAGPAGLLLRDPRGIRLLSPDPTQPPRLLFGPTDDCSIGIDPAFPGLIERDPIGFRLMGQNNQGCRLIFGPTMNCTVEVDPAGPAGLLLRDPRGIRILPPIPPIGPPPGPTRILFGPTDDCSIGIEPGLTGLAERDPIGFRLLGLNNQGCRLLFGPTDLCSVEVDPAGPAGLLLRDPKGIRILSPNPVQPPRMLFGPTDDCSIGIDPAFPGLVERDPIGFRLMGQNDQGCRLIFGPTMACTVEVDPAGPQGLLLRDPRGIRILPPPSPAGQTTPPRILFGPTDDCSIAIAPPPGQTTPQMRFTDPNGFNFQGGPFIVNGQVLFASSRHLKENIRPIGKALETIGKLNGVRYTWKPEQGGKPDIGFIAEEVGEVVPEVVAWADEAKTRATGVNYGHLVAVTVEGIKEQQSQIERQQGEIDSLRNENAGLQERLSKLEALIGNMAKSKTTTSTNDEL